MTSRSSAVWDFVRKLPDSMICTICPDGSQGATLSGNNAGNAKKHLRSYHKVEYEDVESRDAARAAQSQPPQKSNLVQQKLTFTQPEVKPKKPMEPEERQTQKKNLAAFLATPSIPVSIVSNEQFRRLIYGFDKRYKIPTRYVGGTSVLGRQAKAVKQEVKARIQAASSKVSVVVDIWSAHASAYIGATLHFVDSGGRLKVDFLGVRDVEGPKTAIRVREAVDSILSEYEISEEDVGFYITDNGSNLLKAYRESVEEIHFIVANEENDDADDEHDDSDDEGQRPRAVHERTRYNDPNVEETDDDEEDQDSEPQAVADITEHEDLDREYDATFPKRISCFDHCLELVLKKVVEKTNKKASAQMRKARAILRKAKNSPAAKRALLRRTGGKGFILPATTRWGSHFLMAERILIIWKDLNQVGMECEGLAYILRKSCRLLAKVLEIIEPFHAELMAKQRDKKVTASRVYSAIKKLIKHCEKFRNESTDISSLANSLKAEMTRRFGCFINASQLAFNPHYVLSAVLDPSQAFLVDLDSDFICRLIADRAGNEIASEVVSDAESADAEDEDYEEMMLKKRKLEKRLSSQDRTAGHRGRSFTEAKEYVNAVLYQDFRATDPLEWWRSEGSVKYPIVHAVALKYLAVPATSASIERCFSHAGLCVVGKKNRTQENLLDNKLMYHLNENISR